MQKYRYIIRHDHIDEDLALAAGMIKTLKTDKDFRGAVMRKENPAHETNQRNGEVWIVHGTPEELATLTDYEKA